MYVYIYIFIIFTRILRASVKRERDFQIWTAHNEITIKEIRH